MPVVAPHRQLCGESWHVVVKCDAVARRPVLTDIRELPAVQVERAADTRVDGSQ